jgi:hypothetical protein
MSDFLATDLSYFDVGCVPKDQMSCKHASVDFARSLVSCAELDILNQMIEACVSLVPKLPRERVLQGIRIEIRYWERLQVGEFPGYPEWHYDIYPDPKNPKGRDVFHILFFSGAGCVPEFTNYVAKENQFLIYPEKERHRIRAATKEGSRIVLRVTYCPHIFATNRTRDASMHNCFKKTYGGTDV